MLKFLEFCVNFLRGIYKALFVIRYKYHRFVQRYRCLLGARIPRGAPTKEVARVIVDRYLTAPNDRYC